MNINESFKLRPYPSGGSEPEFVFISGDGLMMLMYTSSRKGRDHNPPHVHVKYINKRKSLLIPETRFEGNLECRVAIPRIWGNSDMNSPLSIEEILFFNGISTPDIAKWILDVFNTKDKGLYIYKGFSLYWKLFYKISSETHNFDKIYFYDENFKICEK